MERSVTGLLDLHKQLQSLPVKIEANVMRGGLKAAQTTVKNVAKNLVPVKKGDLKKSIRVSSNRKALKRGVARVDVIAGNATAWYAHLIENGTGSQYTGSGRSVRAPYTIKARKGGALSFGGVGREEVVHPGIKPQPFMQPAVKQLEGPAIDVFVQYVQKRLPREIAEASA